MLSPSPQLPASSENARPQAGHKATALQPLQPSLQKKEGEASMLAKKTGAENIKLFWAERKKIQSRLHESVWVMRDC